MPNVVTFPRVHGAILVWYHPTRTNPGRTIKAAKSVVEAKSAGAGSARLKNAGGL